MQVEVLYKANTREVLAYLDHIEGDYYLTLPVAGKGMYFNEKTALWDSCVWTPFAPSVRERFYEGDQIRIDF